MSSFFPSHKILEYNHVAFLNNATIQVFKSHLVSLFRPSIKSTVRIHDPLGLRSLFQLRLGLRHLRSHKNNHNLEKTPSGVCLCDTGIEDTYHYPFRFLFYAVHRAILATKVISILFWINLNQLGNTVTVYLYRHHSLSDNDNRIIILATIELLKNTNRFTQEL